MAAPCRDLTGLRRGLAAARLAPGRRGANKLCLAPFHHRAPPPQQQQGRRRQRQGLKVVAAISEDLPRLAAPGTGKGAPEGRRPEKVLVRAALTVRRKHKEDLKEALAGHLDALWDMVGRSVALELISTKIHPSKHAGPCSLSSSNPLVSLSLSELTCLLLTSLLCLYFLLPLDSR